MADPKCRKCGEPRESQKHHGFNHPWSSHIFDPTPEAKGEEELPPKQDRGDYWKAQFEWNSGELRAALSGIASLRQQLTAAESAREEALDDAKFCAEEVSLVTARYGRELERLRSVVEAAREVEQYAPAAGLTFPFRHKLTELSAALRALYASPDAGPTEAPDEHFAALAGEVKRLWNENVELRGKLAEEETHAKKMSAVAQRDAGDNISLRSELATVVERTARAQRSDCHNVAIDGCGKWEAPYEVAELVGETPLVTLETLPQEKDFVGTTPSSEAGRGADSGAVAPGMKETGRLQCDCGNPVRGGCGFPGCPLRSAPPPSEEPKAEGNVRRYASRRPWELEPHYSEHIAAMTTENLHAKADIAAELAFRDACIRELEVCFEKSIKEITAELKRSAAREAELAELRKREGK